MHIHFNIRGNKKTSPHYYLQNIDKITVIEQGSLAFPFAPKDQVWLLYAHYGSSAVVFSAAMASTLVVHQRWEQQNV
jgi:putative heme iron utilization protein